MTGSAKPENVDEYIATFPKETQEVLHTIRRVIQRSLPSAEEAISYGIPTFREHGSYIIYFAGFKKHVSLYPAPRTHESFREELAQYKGGKGTVQFSLGEPLPIPLIERIVKFRVAENNKKVKKG